MLPFDERFATFSAATDERMAGSFHFSLCTGCCQVLPQHSAILSVIKLRDSRLQTPIHIQDFALQRVPITACVCPPQPFTGESHHVAASRAKPQETLAGELDFVSCCPLNKVQLVYLSCISAETFLSTEKKQWLHVFIKVRSSRQMVKL